ncbi:MAG: tRNA pseudouridine(54/55) synthase Pus10 [Thermoplasmata archaeon]|nr:tRNA pseudouridine(54/55) synthase Pus10 [Thermoplasmata archaeon]
MEEWIAERIDAARGLASEGLCDRCLGRMFGKVGTGMTNDIRGRMVREALSESGEDLPPSDVCPLCEGIFDLMPRFAENVAEAVNEVESENFLVGTRVEPSIVEAEKALWERYGLESPEAIKSELNREIGKLALPMIHRPVEFKSPQVVALVDTRFGEVTLDIAPLFIAGRYNKYSREIPQTIWPCRECHGKGCPHCSGKGKMYETSVQEIIGDVALEMTGGNEHFFHGMGREDIDACMLGDGRPFVLEISQPKRRFIDLDELEKRASNDMAAFNSLHYVQREAVERYKGAAANKTYRVRVKADGKVNKQAVVDTALSFKDADINQRTPRRVEHRRADLVRKRTIHWVTADCFDEDGFDLQLETDSGTYVKEFVSGDDGRTQPNFSERLGIKCVVTALDVLAIDYHEPRRDSPCRHPEELGQRPATS